MADNSTKTPILSQLHQAARKAKRVKTSSRRPGELRTKDSTGRLVKPPHRVQEQLSNVITTFWSVKYTNTELNNSADNSTCFSPVSFSHNEALNEKVTFNLAE